MSTNTTTCHFCGSPTGRHPMSTPHYPDRDTCLRVTVCTKLTCRDLVRSRRPRKPRTSSPRPQATAGAGDVAGWAAAAQLGRLPR